MFLVDAERQIFQPLCFEKRYAEIGVYLARYSQEIIRFNPSEVYLVDPFIAPDITELLPSDTHLENAESLLQDTFKNYYPDGIENAIPFAYKTVSELFADRPNIKFIRKTSKNAVDDFSENSLDFIHLDANNRFDYVLANLRRWESKVSPDGLIVADNCYVSPIGERQFISSLEAVSRFIKSSDWRPLAISNRWFSNVLLCRKSSVPKNTQKLLSILCESGVAFSELPPECIHSARHKYFNHAAADGTIKTKEYISFAE